MLKQLIHNGIIIPAPPAPLGLSLRVRGELRRLTPKQEEMALAWARKKDTPYVRDPVFAANFMRDFSAALGMEPALRLDEVDFGPCERVIETEHATKEALSPEQRKALAAQRKAEREALRARYGYAIVNSQRVELGAYMAEPSGIFMGRGQHPLRGRWKEGARQEDVTLNLSPDAPPVEGAWGAIVWEPESMWVARWEDRLAAKLKYIWLSDTAPLKQQREAIKFDKAVALDARLQAVRAHIEQGLVAADPRQRMIATACYLIDTLCLRVGDEKDPDEADTVGATTLRPEHVTLREDGVVEFHFLGKDSVEWHKTLMPPQVVLDNLAELVRSARPSTAALGGEKSHPTRDKPQLFPDVSSRDVNAYLSGVQPGLTAKVFRTHHATSAVRDSLSEAQVRPQDPEHCKWQAATLANLAAAVLCNHTKQVSRNWAQTRKRYQERVQQAEERVEQCRAQVMQWTETLAALKQEAHTKEEAAPAPARRKQVRASYRKRIARMQANLDAAKDKRAKAQLALGKLKAQALIATKRRNWNLTTSLKSYIDPRVYHCWGREVDYDVLSRLYPTLLQRKFAWVRTLDDEEEAPHPADEGSGALPARTCMSEDLPAVARLFQAVRERDPEADLPLAVEEIGRQCLPSLDKDWQEAVVVQDEGGEALGFAVIGPYWEQDGEGRLDLTVVLHPEADASAATLLAVEVKRRVRDYQLHHPKQAVSLWPQDERGLRYAPGLGDALGLVGEDEEGEALGDVDDEE